MIRDFIRAVITEADDIVVHKTQEINALFNQIIAKFPDDDFKKRPMTHHEPPFRFYSIMRLRGYNIFQDEINQDLHLRKRVSDAFIFRDKLMQNISHANLDYISLTNCDEDSINQHMLDEYRQYDVLVMTSGWQQRLSILGISKEKLQQCLHIAQTAEQLVILIARFAVTLN